MTNASNSDILFDTNRTTNNNTLLTNNCHRIPVKACNQCMVGLTHDLQQKTIGSQSELVLTPLPGLRVDTISGHKQLGSQTHCFNCWPTGRQNSVKNKTCRTDATEQTEQKALNMVNGEYKSSANRSQPMLTIPMQSTSLGTNGTVNYVNMNFVQSIPLYENIEFVESESRQRIQEIKTNNNPIENSCESEANDKPMDSSDYMLMQPIISCETSYSKNKSPHKSMESISMNPSNQRNIETLNSDNGFNNSIQFVSTNHLSTRLTYLQRSNSSEKRKAKENNFLVSFANPSSCPSSPALTSRVPGKSFSLLSEVYAKNREKSFSIDDVYNTKFNGQNKFLKMCHELAAYKSADCLKQRFEDYRSSEEDLCTSSQITVLCNTPLNSPLKIRTKPLLNGCDIERSDTLLTTNDKLEEVEVKRRQNVHNCSNCLDTTSSSDMSDYIETLSLSSRTSSGSDPTNVEIDNSSRPTETVNNSSLKEYSSDKNVIDCVTHLQKGSAHHIHSPSPGYESENSIV